MDKRFNAESTFWRDVYQRKDVLGTILNQRKIVAIKLIEALSLPKSSSILEIGCGAGYLAVALAGRGFKVKAVDHASSMVELTKTLAKQKGVENRIQATVEDVHDLTFLDNSFDLVIALGVVAWVYDLNKGLREVARVMKPNGHLVLSIDNPHRWWVDPPMFIRGIVNQTLQRLNLKNQSSIAHARYYSIKTIEHYLLNANLNPTEKYILGFGPFSIFNHKLFSDKIGIEVNKKLQKYSSTCSLLRRAGAQYILLAEKISY